MSRLLPLSYLSPLEILLAHDPQYRSLCRACGQAHQAVIRATWDPAQFDLDLVRRLQAAERAAEAALETYLRQQAAAHPEAEPPSRIRKDAPSTPDTSPGCSSPEAPTRR